MTFSITQSYAEYMAHPNTGSPSAEQTFYAGFMRGVGVGMQLLAGTNDQQEFDLQMKRVMAEAYVAYARASN